MQRLRQPSEAVASKQALSSRWPVPGLAVLGDAGFWAALLVALPVLQPLYRPGIGHTADGALHVYRTVELLRLWQEGVIYSRWAPDLAFGLGYPLYNFYTPLFYYVAGALYLLAANFETAVKLALAAILLLSGVGAYALARQWIGRAGAVLAAVAYTWAPFRLREVYLQGDFAQFLALALLPLILWALHRVAVTGGWRYVLATAFAYAGLFLSHSISAMLFTPLLLGYLILLLVVSADARKRVALVGLSLAMGVGLSAFFWLPALYEKQFVQLDALRGGDYDFRRHFAPPLDLVAPSVPLDATAANASQPFNLGLAHLVFALFSLGLVFKRRYRWLVAMGWLGLLGCAFMYLPVSTPVWQAVPLLAFTEFPWRWLGVAALPLALLVGLSAEITGRWRTAYTVAAALAIMLSTFPHLYPREPFGHYDRATVADIVAYELKTQAIGTTSAGEYLPKGVSKPQTSPLVPMYLEGKAVDRLDRTTLPEGATATLMESAPLSHRWKVTAPVDFVVQIHVLYYRGWAAYLDQQLVEITPSAGQGLVTVAIPQGEHQLVLRFEDTQERRLANAFSGATLLLLTGLGFGPSWRKPRLHRELVSGSADRALDVGDRDGTRSALIIGVLAVVLAVGKGAYIDPHTTWFRAASDMEHIPGLSHPLKVSFEDKIQLLGYSVDKRVVHPGESAVVTLYWRALQPVDKQYSVFLHVVGETGRVAQNDTMHPGGIPTRSWRADQFVRDEHPVVIPSQTPPGLYRFLVGLYQHGTMIRLATTEGRDFVALPTALRVGDVDPVKGPTASYTLGEMVSLVAYELVGPSVISPGEAVTVRLRWEAKTRIDRDYTVFVHLYDEEGRLWGVGDGLPVAGLYPTSLWETGEQVDDVHVVRLDENASPGLYHVAVGLYDLETSQRLEARSSGGQHLKDDLIVLEPAIEVRAR